MAPPAKPPTRSWRQRQLPALVTKQLARSHDGDTEPPPPALRRSPCVRPRGHRLRATSDACSGATSTLRDHQRRLRRRNRQSRLPHRRVGARPTTATATDYAAPRCKTHDKALTATPPTALPPSRRSPPWRRRRPTTRPRVARPSTSMLRWRQRHHPTHTTTRRRPPRGGDDNSLAQRRNMTPAAPPAAPPLAPPTTCRRHPMAATAKDRSASRSEAFLHPTADVTWRRRPPGPALHGKAEPLLQGDAPRAALSPSDHSRLCASGSATSSALVRSTSRRAPATTATSGPAREAFALALATTQHTTPPSPTAPPAPARRHASR